MAIYELEDKDGCPDCHHQVSLWLGFSSVDNDGVHLAYRCPNCEFETSDIIPHVDDILPEKIAWRRDDGVVTWFPKNTIKTSEQVNFFSRASVKRAAWRSIYSKREPSTLERVIALLVLLLLIALCLFNNL